MKEDEGTLIKVTTVALLFVLLCAAPSYSCAQTADWLKYYDRATGFSFRYPPSLQAVEDAHSDLLNDDLHMHVKKVIELTSKVKLDQVSEPDVPVLRFLLKENGVYPERPWVETFETQRRGCRHWRSLRIDGHRALECVICGRGACHWSIELFQPRRCSIFSLWHGADDDEPDVQKVHPHDGRLPLQTIVKTVHFTAPK